MILFVDTEHSSGYSKPSGEWLYAARTRIKYRLEDVTHDEVYLVRYDHVTEELVSKLGARAIFLSGSASTPDDFEPGQQDGMNAVIRSMSVPIFGFCGGLQVMGTALDVPLEQIGPLEHDEIDPNPDMAPGMKKESGYMPVPITNDHPMLSGLGTAPIMRQAHSWELKEVPTGFHVYAASDMTPIQMVIHDELPVVGTQFHPEYWTDEHPAGRQLIENFCRIAGLL